VVEAGHESMLTRDDITASVHYIAFSLTDAEIAAFPAGPVLVEIDHPNYSASTTLGAETITELLGDLRF
jgi:hypothetical protein